MLVVGVLVVVVGVLVVVVGVLCVVVVCGGCAGVVLGLCCGWWFGCGGGGSCGWWFVFFFEWCWYGSGQLWWLVVVW